MKPNSLVSKIDQWIVGTMHRTAAVSSWLSGKIADVAGINEVLTAARAAGLHDVQQCTIESVTQFFGAPLTKEPHHVVFELLLWPDHLYEWIWAKDGTLFRSGFVRRWGGEVPKGMNIHAAAGLLRPWYHTELDINRALGKPLEVNGWWPEYTFVYALSSDDQVLKLTLQHGLLVEHPEPPPVSSAPRRSADDVA